jgi:hypothetical protein
LKKDGSAWCTAVSPNVKLDFDKPSSPGVNGSICHLPEPEFEAQPPWSVCKRWKPVGVKGAESQLSGGWASHMDRRVLYASVLLIVVLGVIYNQSNFEIYSYVALFLIALIVIANIFMIWRKVRPGKGSET